MKGLRAKGCTLVSIESTTLEDMGDIEGNSFLIKGRVFKCYKRYCSFSKELGFPKILKEIPLIS